jgi:hypothetical protein
MDAQLGSKGLAVKWVQHVLNEQGYGPITEDGIFGRATEEALQEFQGGHIGPNGDPLIPHGRVTPNTHWALRFASGDQQRNYFEDKIPEGIEGKRKKLLETFLQEHKKGVKEIPDGSNWGPEIKEYGGRPGEPWCCFFWSWVTLQVFDKYIMGKLYAKVFDVYTKAQDKGWFRWKKNYIPIPGDAFIMLYRNDKGRFTGKGHIGIVLAVSGDGLSFNTVEGNSSNRVAIRKRRMNQKSLVGFVNHYSPEDQPKKWSRGLVSPKIKTEDNKGRTR